MAQMTPLESIKMQRARQYVTRPANHTVPALMRYQAIQRNISACWTLSQLDGCRQWAENTANEYGPKLWQFYDDKLLSLWAEKFAIIDKLSSLNA